MTVFNVLSEHAPTEEEGDPAFKQKGGRSKFGNALAMAEYLAIPAENAIPASEEIPAEISVLAEPEPSPCMDSTDLTKSLSGLKNRDYWFRNHRSLLFAVSLGSRM